MKPTRYTEEMIAEYVGKGVWDDTTFAQVWDRNAEQYPQKEAIVDSRTRLTWAEAKQRIDRIALGLMELGIGEDKVLVVQLPNCAELMLLYVACEKAGIINLTIYRTMRHKEVEYMLANTEAEGIVIPWKFRDFDHFAMIQEMKPNLPHLKHVIVAGDEVPEGAISLEEMMRQPLEEKLPPQKLQERRFPAFEVTRIRHTTGTTGMPKLVEETICNRMLLARELVRTFQLTSEDVLAAPTPLTGGPGAPAMLSAPLLGAKSVCEEHFNPDELLRLIEKEGVTAMGVVPTVLERLAHHPNVGKYDLSSLRIICCSGAPLAPELAVEAEQKLGCPIMQRYGIIDAGTISATMADDPQEVRHKTVGKPHPGNEVKLIDEAGNEMPPGTDGEIVFRGPLTHPGYFRDPERTWQTWGREGWYATGDLGRFDARGNLMIVGRVKDMIIRGGNNIYPIEIEGPLTMHPKVADVAVVGMPDPVMGEKVCAYVVLRPGEQLTLDEVLSFLKEKDLQPWKLPERLEIIAEMPYVAGQKVNKKALRQDIADKLKAEGK
jgi:non-ribosomal peptide synthetase component E (peptide arylation enzyme)